MSSSGLVGAGSGDVVDSGARMAWITAILPAFNEESAIGSVVLRAKKYVDRVIVVDDGSSYVLEQLFFVQAGQARR